MTIQIYYHNPFLIQKIRSGCLHWLAMCSEICTANKNEAHLLDMPILCNQKPTTILDPLCLPICRWHTTTTKQSMQPTFDQINLFSTIQNSISTLEISPSSLISKYANPNDHVPLEITNEISQTSVLCNKAYGALFSNYNYRSQSWVLIWTLILSFVFFTRRWRTTDHV